MLSFPESQLKACKLKSRICAIADWQQILPPLFGIDQLACLIYPCYRGGSRGWPALLGTRSDFRTISITISIWVWANFRWHGQICRLDPPLCYAVSGVETLGQKGTCPLNISCKKIYLSTRRSGDKQRGKNDCLYFALIVLPTLEKWPWLQHWLFYNSSMTFILASALTLI